MLPISLSSILIKNFRSIKDQSFTFPTSNGLKYLYGDNQREPRLGANGAGKSSFLEASFWCKYGVSSRGIRTSGLLSWGESKVEVSETLQIGNELHTIRRFGPPMKIELDGAQVDQSAIDSLLKLSKERFTHSVVFGQGVKLFPDLSIADRGALLDEVLNLQIWSNCTDSASKTFSLLQTKIVEKEKILAGIDGQISTLRTVEELQTNIDSFEAERARLLLHYNNQSQNWITEAAHRQERTAEAIQKWQAAHHTALSSKIEELENLETANAAITLEIDTLVGVNETAYAMLADNIKEKEKALDEKSKHFIKAEMALETTARKIHFWENNQQCPECNRPINREESHTRLVEERTRWAMTDRMAEAAKLQITQTRKELQELNKVYNEWTVLKALVEQRRKAAIELHANNEQKLGKLENEAEALLKAICPIQATVEINPYLEQITQLQNKTNPYIMELEKVKRETALLLENREQSRSSIESLTSEQTCVEYWKSGFKRIRLFFIERVLAALEIEIAGALSALGLTEWAVALATEMETKSGTTKLGVQINIKSPTSEGPWESWSGGETQRLRLAIALGLSSLIQRAAGVAYSYAVFDEPTQHLSPEGVEDLLEALNNKADASKLQIWIADHSALTYSGFSEIYKVTKGADGSQIARLS